MQYKKIIIISIVTLLAIALCFVDAILINPHNIKIREETIESDKLSEKQNDFIVAYFSDLYFGDLINEEDVDKTIELINSINPDVVLFGGDLIDSNYSINDNQKSYLTSKLKEITYRYGKFAVLGEQDLVNNDVMYNTISILQAGDFNLLINENAKVYVDGNNYFNIVGIDSMVLGSPDIASAFDGVNTNNYTIVLTHCPDTFNDLDSSYGDLTLAGHSLGGQVYLPLISLINRDLGARSYMKNSHTKNGITLDITNGVGLKNKSARFLADAEVVFYKFEASAS